METVEVTYWLAARTADDKWGVDATGTFAAESFEAAQRIAGDMARAYADSSEWARTWCAIEAPAEWAGEAAYDVWLGTVTWIPA